MTHLILATTTSPLLFTVATRLQHQTAGDCVVISTDPDAQRSLKAALISSLHLQPTVKFDWAERDEKFRSLFMPGQQWDWELPGTHLTAWKVLALDRLSFWFHGAALDSLYEQVMALRWEVAFAAADLRHPLPWALARNSDRPVIGVQVGSLRTREWFDLAQAKLIPFPGMFVNSAADAVFLKKIGYDGEVTAL